MSATTTDVLSILTTIVGSTNAKLAIRVLRTNNNLRLAIPSETSETTATNTAVAHNSDFTASIPVRDIRIPDVPLLLHPVREKQGDDKVIITYRVILDPDKITKLGPCKLFAPLYLAKKLRKATSFASLLASTFVSAMRDDICNTARTNEKTKLKKAAKMRAAAKGFVILPEEVWLTLRSGLEDQNEALVEMIDEMRADADQAGAPLA